MENMELALEKHKTENNTPSCGKGWSHRCAAAKSKICTCSCGGANHGKKRMANNNTERHQEHQENIGVIYSYQGFGGCESKCGLKVKRNNGVMIILLTELSDNTGTSITNCYEHIATSIYKERLVHIPAEAIIWIEHYPADGGFKEGDTFDKVKMEWDGRRFNNPQWERLTEQEVKALTGDYGTR